MARRYGSKYGETDPVQIAKMVRADLKDATKRGDFPKGTKFSVKVERFSGGRSIDVNIVELPGIVIVERAQGDLNLYGKHETKYVPTAETKAFMARAEAILQAYNHDGSDAMSDYWDVNFYGHAELGSELHENARLALKAQDGDLDSIVTFGLRKLQIDAPIWKWSKPEKEDVAVWLDGVEQGKPVNEPDVIQATKAAMAAKEQIKRAARGGAVAARVGRGTR